MSIQSAYAAAAVIAVYLLEDEEGPEQKKRKRKIWVHELMTKRESLGFYADFCKDFRTNNHDLYKNFVRMSPEDFDYLLEKVRPKIQKKDTRMRKANSPGERLVITLRYLATGDSFKSLMYLFRVEQSTISKIIPEVCAAIYDVLKDDFIQTPSKTSDWEKISQVFYNKCDFPNCIGALDGKHIVIKAPANSGSEYFNYKGSFSIVLMGLADATYKLTYIDVGQSGHNADGGVFSHCSLSNALRDNTLNVPTKKMLPKTNKSMPYVIVADDAFAMKPYLLKPYSLRNMDCGQRIFNYRLSRARRIVENVFGIMSARFRVLRRPIELNPTKATTTVLAICALHNFIMYRQSRSLYAMPGDFDMENDNGEIIPGSWRKEQATNIFPLHTEYHGSSSTEAKQVREEFKNYFMTPEGEIPWQYKFI